MQFVSEEWVAALAERGAALPKVEGATVSCQHEIAGAPDGKVRFFIRWVDGQVAEAAVGKMKDADTMIVCKAPDALDVLRGVKEPEVSFMQGRLKVDGDYRRLLVDLREWRSSDGYRAMWQEMADLTE